MRRNEKTREQKESGIRKDVERNGGSLGKYWKMGMNVNNFTIRIIKGNGGSRRTILRKRLESK